MLRPCGLLTLIAWSGLGAKTTSPTRAPTIAPSGAPTIAPIQPGYFSGVFYQGPGCGNSSVYDTTMAQLNHRYAGQCETCSDALQSLLPNVDCSTRYAFTQGRTPDEFSVVFKLFKNKDCSSRGTLYLSTSEVINTDGVSWDDTFINGECYNVSTSPFPATSVNFGTDSYLFNFYPLGSTKAPKWSVSGYAQFLFNSSSACSSFKDDSQLTYEEATVFVDRACLRMDNRTSMQYSCGQTNSFDAVEGSYHSSTACCLDNTGSSSWCAYEPKYLQVTPLESTDDSMCSGSSPSKNTCLYESPLYKSPSSPPFLFAHYQFYHGSTCCYSPADLASNGTDLRYVDVSACGSKGSISPFYEQVQHLNTCLVLYGDGGKGPATGSYKVTYEEASVLGDYFLEHVSFSSLDCSGQGKYQHFDGKGGRNENAYNVFSATHCNSKNTLFLNEFYRPSSLNVSFRLTISSSLERAPVMSSTGLRLDTSVSAGCGVGTLSKEEVFRQGACIPDVTHNTSFIYFCSVGKYFIRKFYPSSTTCCDGDFHGCGMQTSYSESFDCRSNSNIFANKAPWIGGLYETTFCDAPLSAALLAYERAQVDEWKITLVIASLSIAAGLMTVVAILSTWKFTENNVLVLSLVIAQLLFDVSFLAPFCYVVRRYLIVSSTDASTLEQNKLYLADEFLRNFAGILVSLLSNLLACTVCFIVITFRAPRIRKIILPVIACLFTVAFSIAISQAVVAMQEVSGANVTTNSQDTNEHKKVNFHTLIDLVVSIILVAFNAILIVVLAARVFTMKRDGRPTSIVSDSSRCSTPSKSRALFALVFRFSLYALVQTIVLVVRVADKFTVDYSNDDGAYQSSTYINSLYVYALLVPSAGFWFALIYFRYNPHIIARLSHRRVLSFRSAHTSRKSLASKDHIPAPAESKEDEKQQEKVQSDEILGHVEPEAHSDAMNMGDEELYDIIEASSDAAMPSSEGQSGLELPGHTTKAPKPKRVSVAVDLACVYSSNDDVEERTTESARLSSSSAEGKSQPQQQLQRPQLALVNPLHLDSASARRLSSEK